MLVIIPHQDDALKIIKLQKELQKDLAARGFFYYSKPPVWFSLGNQSEEAYKSLKIQKVIMSAPLLKNGSLFSKITAICEDQTIETEYTLLYPADGTITPEENTVSNTLNTILEQKKILNFPKGFRIFRLALSETLSENAAAVSESRWVKLPK